MYHNQGISFYVVLLCFIRMFTGVICGLQGPGACFERFQVNNTLNRTNGPFVCNNSTTSAFTDTVYLDISRVPVLDTSECLCSITFQDNKMDYDVELELKIGSIAGNNLTVKGFGITISPNSVHRASTNIQKNSLLFSMTTGNKDLNACLRIMGLEQTDVFQAQCSQSVIRHQGLDDNPTEIPEGNPTDIQEGISTEIPLQNHEEVTSEANPKTGAIIGGSVGAAVLVVLVVVAIVILLKRRCRKRTTTQKEEDYYMSENPMYNQPNSTQQKLPDHPPITNDYQLAHDYDAIQSSNKIKDDTDYSAVDKGKATSNVPLGTQQEDEYNHLNEIRVIAATGNVYSSTGNRNIESNTGDFYKCAANGVQKRSAKSKIAENVYDNRT